ncbi:hypothetical protein RBB77_13110 [Tunturibacter psychrotolerans]|uniref:Uncharacterized protein n=1 Tax=Tunturiibacter psychrotolerans TaxID=3069686 RepID=A0AAU7ZK75_9BACT
MHLIWQVNMYDPPVTLPLPRIVNLLTDLKEERDAGVKAGFLTVPMTKILAEWESSLEKYRRLRWVHLTPTFRQKE